MTLTRARTVARATKKQPAVTIVLTAQDRQQLVAFVTLLITVDRRTRRTQNKTTQTTKEKNNGSSKRVSRCFLVQFNLEFIDNEFIFMSDTNHSLQSSSYDRHHCSYAYQRHVSH